MLSTSFCGLKMKNPTVLASGIMGVNADSLERIAKEGAGAVTIKSIGPKKKAGHSNPTVVVWEHGIHNAVGLTTAGYKNMEKEWQEISRIKVPVIASIYGGSIAEFQEVAKFVAQKKPAMIELNISCPNSEKHGLVFGCVPEIAGDVVRAVKKVSGKIPVMPKLTPNTHEIVRVAKECEKAGADAIAAINTLQGMIINIDAGKPVLAFKKGGISGPAIKPIAVRCVYEIYEAVNVPILGIGGIESGRDAIEMMQAGASAVGIGSAVYSRGTNVFSEVCEEMQDWMKKNNVKRAKELVGIAHE
jgi:dihydroorotate dehydrogenase (NAD+) catalytic subunit